MDGDIAVIAANHDDDNGLESGSAYVFTRDANGVWTERLNGYSTREAINLLKGPSADDIEPNLFGTPEARRRWLKTRLFLRVPPFQAPPPGAADAITSRHGPAAPRHRGKRQTQLRPAPLNFHADFSMLR